MLTATEETGAQAVIAADRPPSETAPAPRMVGLDGIRALAVIAVVVYHFDPSWLPGGFFGVDVFFVISGFLITGLVVREWERTGRIDLLSFWVRRARRLLPALIALLAAVVLVSAVFAPDALARLRTDVPAALLLRHQLVVRLPQGQLLPGRGTSLAAPAPVVAGHRGAVLRPVAARPDSAPAQGQTAEPGSPSAPRWWPSAPPCHGRALPARRHRSLPGVLRHRHPCPGPAHRMHPGPGPAPCPPGPPPVSLLADRVRTPWGWSPGVPGVGWCST